MQNTAATAEGTAGKEVDLAAQTWSSPKPALREPQGEILPLPQRSGDAMQHYRTVFMNPLTKGGQRSLEHTPTSTLCGTSVLRGPEEMHSATC